MGGDAIYVSGLPYHTKRMHAAAVYCSDGRVCEQYDDFLRNGLRLPRHDRVALPGGPACLAGHDQTRIEEAGVLDELGFLVSAHGLDRIVLIQHEDCAFYRVRLGVRHAAKERMQRADLVRAARTIRGAIDPRLEVLGFFARRRTAGVAFEAVDLP